MKLLNELLAEAEHPSFPLLKVLYIRELTHVDFQIAGESNTVAQSDSAVVSRALKDIAAGKMSCREAHREVVSYMKQIPSASKRVPKYEVSTSTKPTKNVLSLLLIKDPLLWHVTHENKAVRTLVNDFLGKDFKDRDVIGLQHALIDADLGEYAEGDL